MSENTTNSTHQGLNINDRLVQRSKLDLENSEPSVLSVEQLNSYIKQLIEGQVGQIWVKGEISNFKPHTSGHYYFSLKDKSAQISAVMFRGYNSKLKFKPHDGLEVIIRGKISVYEPRGTYQIYAESMEPVGAGALQKAFEQLRDKLKAEGLFDAKRKRPLPTYPRHIAVVTSPTGAAIRDILNILSRRAPSIQVTVIPTIVQGSTAAPLICDALQLAMKLKNVDVIICGRGGGSIEDMWCFNDETLARTIAASSVPVISAVGHEIDFTIADFVADLRAPTPSAAAELVAKSNHELTQKVQQLQRILSISIEKRLHTLQEKIKRLGKQLVDPQKKLQDLAVRNDDLFDRMNLAMAHLIKNKIYRIDLLAQKLGSPDDQIHRLRQKLNLLNIRQNNLIDKNIERKKTYLNRLMSVLDSISPLQVVKRGYSIVTIDSKVVKSIQQVDVQKQIQVQVSDGQFIAQVTQVKG